MTCSHSLGPLSDMKTVGVDRDYYFRKCQICGFKETLYRAGKTYTGYSIQAETGRDFERREYAKDLLQGFEVDGSTNELFREAYGEPKKRGKSRKGAKIESMRIKDAKKSN